MESLRPPKEQMHPNQTQMFARYHYQKGMPPFIVNIFDLCEEANSRSRNFFEFFEYMLTMLEEMHDENDFEEGAELSSD